MSDARPRILLLGANFAGRTTARYVTEKVGDRSRITVIDRKPYLTFIPNIPLEVWNDNNPEVSLHLPATRYFEKDGSEEVLDQLLPMMEEMGFEDTGFEEMYHSLGGTIPRWGLPLSELVADRSPA